MSSAPLQKPWYLDPLFWWMQAAALPVWGVALAGSSGQPNLGWMMLHPGAAVSVLLLWPLAEELLFRAGLQTWLLQRWPAHCWVSRANVITSLCFALTHYWLQPGWLALAVFFPSLLFGVLRERHRGVTSSTLLHCSYNVGWFMLFPPLL
ncbi:hypothetical protein CHH28_02090 [Bacterioplanes sanyensis]|uniref:CAAX prenyl protease 2/Lysostaphin resistance protein A-like domain-containing protein n=1 Tax=Bacterioplanes sanyensis TaxID=1249553 RepID=A0A222FG23_9GAMM|nr:JDVT-CTERM system glutamic-type intramembrane protease [Bacterioplanes sanyensis]ASP37536.1 hypothetical protein CHH28_02090 [Bacterioplanes sanyensis]